MHKSVPRLQMGLQEAAPEEKAIEGSAENRLSSPLLKKKEKKNASCNLENILGVGKDLSFLLSSFFFSFSFVSFSSSVCPGSHQSLKK